MGLVSLRPLLNIHSIATSYHLNGGRTITDSEVFTDIEGINTTEVVTDVQSITDSNNLNNTEGITHGKVTEQ